MGTEQIISVSIDHIAGTGYLRFSGAQVVRTDEFDDATLVDLDEYGMVIGIEILDLGAQVPLDALLERYHITTQAAALLRAVRDHSQHRVTPTAVPAGNSTEYGSASIRGTQQVIARS